MFRFNKDSISFKISVGYLIIIACILLTSIFTLLTLYSNKQSDTVLVKMYLPALNTAKDLKILTLESKKLAYNWIYNPTNDEKQRFIEILKTGLSKSKTEISSIIQSAKNQDSLVLLLDKNVIAKIDTLVISYKKIPDILNSDDAYSDDSTVDKAIGVYNSEVELKATNLMANTEYLIKFIETNIAIINHKKADLYLLLTYMVFFSLFTIIAVSIFFTSFSKNKISKPIIQLRDIIAKLGQGEEVADANLELKRKDEIGQISNALSKLNTGLISKSAFAKAIGEAQYDFQFELLGENDVMGKSLIHMKDNLFQNHIEDKNRNWVNVGLADMGVILRKTFASQHDFYNEIIQFIVKYLHANQGGVFILNDSQENEKFLELTACYAYERKKFLEKRIEIGEGLVGQCFLEKDIIFLTQVPQNYVAITSGLGHSTPNCLVIVPLIYNENILGVLEIASFKIFEKFEIEFIKKLAESVASSISSVKINESTRKLLEHSQQQGEALRAQEEEMRQNLEEMQATQEEMLRKQKTIEENERMMQSMVNNTPGAVYRCITDEKLSMIYISAKIERIAGYKPEEFISKEISVGTLIHPEDLQYTENETFSAIKEKRPYELNYRLRHKEGHYLYVWDIGVAAGHDENGNVLIEGQIIDVTNIKNKENESNKIMAQSKSELETLEAEIEILKMEIRKKDKLLNKS